MIKVKNMLDLYNNYELKKLQTVRMVSLLEGARETLEFKDSESLKDYVLRQIKDGKIPYEVFYSS